jgi:hypothetical protein
MTASDGRVANPTRCSRTEAMTTASTAIRSELGEHWPGYLPLGGREDVCLVARLRRLRIRWERRADMHEAFPQTRLLPHHPPTAHGITLTFEDRDAGRPRGCPRPRPCSGVMSDRSLSPAWLASWASREPVQCGR